MLTAIMNQRRLFSLLFLVPALAHAAACHDRQSPTSPNSPAPGAATVTLASLAISPSAINGGGTVVGTATLSAPAPVSGATVTLASNSSAASVPASIAVPPGATTAAFTVTTAVVTAATDVVITGASGGTQRTAAFRVGASSIPSQPGGPLASFGTLHDDVIGGDNTHGTVTLDRPAPAGGITVRVAAGDAVVEVPASVTIPAGASSATFKVGTLPVATERAVTLTASVDPLPGMSRAALTIQFTLRVMPAVPGLTAIDPAQGVQGASVNVTLTGTSFWSGATIAVSGADVTAGSLAVVNGTSMSATLTIGASAAIGARNVTVTTAGGTSVARTFTVTSSNAAPAADNDSYTGSEDSVLNVPAPGVLDGDTDPDGNALTSVLVTSVSHGTLTLNANGSFVYTPNENFNGSDSFTYRATDGAAASDTVTVTLAINAVVDEQVFLFTGGAQNFTVPNGVTSIAIEAQGAEGGDSLSGAGGKGGSVTATLAVGPAEVLQTGQILQVFVGGAGGFAAASPFNGGGSARSGTGAAATGGGGSDVRKTAYGLADRLIVAGGGGGGGGRSSAGGMGGAGGAGGATVGATGSPGSGASDNTMPGTGGTQTAGGTSPWPTGAGTLGVGGAGGGANSFSAQGGGGGGGYYGGGGGAPAGNTLSFISGAAGGGGGGSSFAHATATNVSHQQGVRSGNGIVIIRW